MITVETFLSCRLLRDKNNYLIITSQCPKRVGKYNKKVSTEQTEKSAPRSTKAVNEVCRKRGTKKDKQGCKFTTEKISSREYCIIT